MKATIFVVSFCVLCGVVPTPRAIEGPKLIILCKRMFLAAANCRELISPTPNTLPPTNMAPVGGYPGDQFPLGGTCQVPCGKEGTSF